MKTSKASCIGDFKYNMIHECSPKRCLNAHEMKCAKGFPKPFQEATSLDENQYLSGNSPWTLQLCPQMGLLQVR